MLFPRRMKYVEFVVLKNDMDAVIEYLGKKSEIQFPEEEKSAVNQTVLSIKNLVERLKSASDYLNDSAFGNEKAVNSGNNINNQIEEDFSIPSETEKTLAENLCSFAQDLKDREESATHELQRIQESINELKVFSDMNVQFSDFEDISYLTLRFGRLDPDELNKLRKNLGDRVAVIPLKDNCILAATSKKGRFALDAQLSQLPFEPAKIPEMCGSPEEIMANLREQSIAGEEKLNKIKNEKDAFIKKCMPDIKKLLISWRCALTIEEIKARFKATERMYNFSGWIPADIVKKTVKDLSQITEGRIAVNAFKPYEVPSIRSGKEKVPVAMKHSAFVKGFEGVVFSYGAPMYGTIDPTALVAFFFTIMFGIMFGDMGQAFVLLLTGFIIKHSSKKLVRFRKFSTPLISVGIASMIMGFLSGSVFANETLLIAPARAITEFFTGEPRDRILQILPMAEHGGSIIKLLYFFAFTVAIGVVINSLGLIINIVNRCMFKKYEQAFFSKTGLAGLLMFWYAVFIAVKLIAGGKFYKLDILGICIPLFFIVFGHVIWRFFTGRKFHMESGLFAFMMEGFVEILDTVSSYISNTASFLRVGAFALAHAVFSFIIFFFTDSLTGSGTAGAFSAALIMIVGNAIIITLEGLIVAIQVMRLQYYEFFNKFFVETGVEFAPFRFQHKEL
ncbi:MAG: V-type ATP synthase subunit I [Treponema sp.]|nr:V-type ATP synthase subunit I [Treponema sp.]